MHNAIRTIFLGTCAGLAAVWGVVGFVFLMQVQGLRTEQAKMERELAAANGRVDAMERTVRRLETAQDRGAAPAGNRYQPGKAHCLAQRRRNCAHPPIHQSSPAGRADSGTRIQDRRRACAVSVAGDAAGCGREISEIGGNSIYNRPERRNCNQQSGRGARRPDDPGGITAARAGFGKLRARFRISFRRRA